MSLVRPPLSTRSSHAHALLSRRVVRPFAIATLLSSLIASPLFAQKLSRDEQRLRDYLRAHENESIDFLQRVVDISSGTMNQKGVRDVGAVFGKELESIGFQVRWIAMPDSLQRAGHLFAERTGTKGKRVLLIGHLDTVFEGEGQRFVRQDSIGRGAGTSDMKGGDVAIVWALKALQSIGALNGTNVIVAFTGDEESAGDPLSVARADLINAAKRSDVALAFEGGSTGSASIARRGASSWQLRVTGRQSHSSGIFADGVGYGAVFEAARILDGFRQALAGQKYLTFNPAVVAGGTDVQYDTLHSSGQAAGKLNIVPRSVVVQGDLRFLSEEQKDRARATMREIVDKHLPGTSATITFADEYPAMSPTVENEQLLARLDTVSRALGYGPVTAGDPGRRGAGDVSFVAPLLPGLDGLGVSGGGSHTPDESVLLPSIRASAERAALLIYRLTREPRPKEPRGSRTTVTSGLPADSARRGQ